MSELQPLLPTIILVIVALIFIGKAFKVVPQQHAYVVERLGELLGAPVTTSPQARFAGANGAAVRAAALA